MPRNSSETPLPPRIRPPFRRAAALALSRRALAALAALLAPCALATAGCATVRVTDPPRTADEQFLLSVAVNRAVADLSVAELRDRSIYVSPRYVYGTNDPLQEQSYLLGEVRNKLLLEGARLAESPEDAEIILEVRSGALGINRYDYLLGFPGVAANAGSIDVSGADVPLILPELAIIKSLDQRGYASVSITAYFRESGELAASSGPFLGRTQRRDFWFFGIGPRTQGDIPVVQD